VKNGWIKLYRQICDNEFLWEDKPFSRGQAWIDLVLTAQRDESFFYRQKITVERGQQIIVYNELAERWGWNKTRAYRFIISLQELKMVTLKKCRCGTLLTIENYSFFQGDWNAKNVEQKRNENWNAIELGTQQVDGDDWNNNWTDNGTPYILNRNKEYIYIVGYLNEKTGKSFKPTTKATVSRINARLKEGFTPDDFKTVIDSRVDKWANDPKMAEFLRPETLFGTKFEGYLNAANLDKKNISKGKGIDYEPIK